MQTAKDELSVYTYRFFFTLQRLPAGGSYLFVSHALPPVKTLEWHKVNEKDKGLLGNRTLLLDHEGRLGLFIGHVMKVPRLKKIILPGEVESGEWILNIANNCEKEWSAAGALQVEKRAEIIMATVISPKNVRGTCKVLLNGEALFAYVPNGVKI